MNRSFNPDRLLATSLSSLPALVLGLGIVSFAGCSEDDVSGPSEPTHLAFTVQPVTQSVGAPLAPSIAVVVRDAGGETAWDWEEPVSLALQTAGAGAELSGNTAVIPVGGTAIFEDLRMSAPGSDFRLMATSGSLEEAVSEPFEVMETFRSGSITAGHYHTCALGEDGTAFCWGSNAYGQLGIGDLTERPVPTRVDTELRFASLSAGESNTCGLTLEGEAYCWGSNAERTLGTTTTELCPNGEWDPVACSSTPVPVSGGHLWRDLSAGASHVCGMTVGGEAYCWGGNYFGQLGDGTQEDREAPGAPSGALAIASIEAGYLHTCALTPEGEAQCWGYNGYGEVGDSTYARRYEPTPVKGGLRFSSIFPGGGSCHGHTCGITTDGAVYCWGRKYQLWDNGFSGPFYPVPVELQGNPGFAEITVGGYSVCGLTNQGKLFCWGDGSYRGGVGNGQVTDQNDPTPIRPDLSFSTATGGRYHTCAVTPEGETYCWGLNTNGQLGNHANRYGWTVPMAVWGVPEG